MVRERRERETEWERARFEFKADRGSDEVGAVRVPGDPLATSADVAEQPLRLCHPIHSFVRLAVIRLPLHGEPFESHLTSNIRRSHGYLVLLVLLGHHIFGPIGVSFDPHADVIVPHGMSPPCEGSSKTLVAAGTRVDRCSVVSVDRCTRVYQTRVKFGVSYAPP